MLFGAIQYTYKNTMWFSKSQSLSSKTWFKIRGLKVWHIPMHQQLETSVLIGFQPVFGMWYILPSEFTVLSNIFFQVKTTSTLTVFLLYIKSRVPQMKCKCLQKLCNQSGNQLATLCFASLHPTALSITAVPWMSFGLRKLPHYELWAVEQNQATIFIVVAWSCQLMQ